MSHERNAIHVETHKSGHWFAICVYLYQTYHTTPRSESLK